MPDISMCEGGECPLQEICYRHVATPNPYRQSYFGVPPYMEEENDCEFLWLKEDEGD